MSTSRSSRFSRLNPFRRAPTDAQTPPSDTSAQQTAAASVASNAASASSNTAPQPFPQGLEIVSEGDDPVVDIVAVHGLNGHRDNTWTANNGVHWLRDLLPDDLPRARIFCWGYDANTHPGSRVSCQYLYDHARNLISDLCRKRKISNSMERPILFVAHSLGGIVVKSALIHSDAARRGALEEHRSIKVSTYGIIFLGTPHQGGNGVQLGKLLVNIASVFVAADDRILKHLERDSEWLQQQLGQYGPISGDFVTKFAFEEYKTPTVLGQSIMVVPRASAVVPGQADAEPIAIHADHVNMVRYMSRQDSGYNTISEHLHIMVNTAVEEIRRRWEAETKVNEARSESSGATFTVGFSLSEVTEVEQFVARQEELAQIRKVLGEGSGRQTAVIHGLGGMGKSQLAVAYAKRHRDNYSAVFWLNARDEVSLKQGFLRAAERILREHPSVVYLKNAVESRDLDQTLQAVKQWLDNPKNDRWLVVYDNYDNPRLVRGGQTSKDNEADGEADGDLDTGSKSYDIRRFFPDAYHGAVLITTRSSRVEVGHRIPLKKLKDVKDSLEILSHTSSRKKLYQDTAAIELARELDGLPLALSTAGAYLNNVATTFTEYLRMYRESWRCLQMATPSPLSYEDRALYSTWDLSFSQVQKKNTTSAMLLRLWAYFDHEDLWFELLREGRSRGPPWFRELMADTLEFDAAVRVLCEYGLVEADATAEEHGTESRGYGMHSCVHAWTIHVLNEIKNDDMAQLAMRCVGLHVPASIEQEYWLVQRRLLRHASRCLTIAVKGMSVAKGDEWVLGSLGNLFSSQDRLDDAEAMYQRALQGEEQTLGRNHTSTLETVNSLGVLYYTQGRLDEAEAMYQRALHGYEQALGCDHTSTLSIVSNLGNLYLGQSRFNDAKAMFERALQGYETALGRNHTSTLDVVNNLGVFYVDQGRLDEAEAMYQRALHGYEKALGCNHTSTLDVVSNLGLLYADQGRLDEAEAMYERALKGREQALGRNHTSTLNTVNNLGNLYKAQGKLDKAEAVYQQALKGKEQVLGRNHMSVLNTVNNLGNLYCTQGRLDEAKAMYQRALQGKEQALGRDHTSTLDTVNNLGFLYADQDRLEDAEAMYKRALQGYEKALGRERVDNYIPALNTIQNLAMLYAQWGRISEARVLYVRCQGGLQTVLGAQHDRYTSVAGALASLDKDT